MARHFTQWVLQEKLGWEEFEDLCTTFLFCQQGYQTIRQAGRVGDAGRDAVVLHGAQEAIVFAFSKERAPLTGSAGKFHREYARWRGQGLRRFVFVSSQDLGSRKIDVAAALSDPPADIFDITDLVRFLDYTAEGQQAKRHHGIDLSGPVVATILDPDSTQPARDLTRYTFLSMSDVSHGGAKRYTGDLLINVPFSIASVRQIVTEATLALRTAEVYRNEITRAYWAGLPTQAVWLFVYLALDDRFGVNWICRCQWLSPDLPVQFRPMVLKGNDEVEGTVIDWNDAYVGRARLIHTSTLPQARYLGQVSELLTKLEPLMSTVLRLHAAYTNHQLGPDEYADQMAALEPSVFECYRRAGDIGRPPASCHDLARAFRGMVNAANNIVFMFSERGQAARPPRPRDFLVKTALDDYQAGMETVRSERRQLSNP